MKRLLTAVALATLIGTPALAADMALKAPPLPPPPVWSWTGWYVGVNLGDSWANDPENFSLPFASFALSNTATSSSLIGGGQIGYNYQINHIVLGAEADIDGRHNSSNFSCFVNSVVSTTGCSPSSASILGMSDQQNWLGTVRGRLGVAFNRFFLYGTGGLAYGNVQHTLSETQLTGVGGTTLAVLSVSDSTTRTGWAAGVGAEYAITDRWSVGVEYLHADLGTDTLSTPNPAVTISGVTFNPSSATFHDRSDMVRAVVDYRFNWGGPY